MLALIAGKGRLPLALVHALPAKPHIAALEGFEPEGLTPDRVFRLEHLGTLIAELQALGVTEICLAGGVSRPDIDPTRIDVATAPLVPQIAQALSRGDDNALRIVIEIFEQAGFKVRGAHRIAPALLPAPGVPTQRQPDDMHNVDSVRAAAVMAAVGPLDVGQACVVQGGQVLAIEAAPGTEFMLASLKAYSRENGGVFYKATKPGQDRRADLPVIGVDTVAAVAAAGLDGLVIEAGGVMVLDMDDVIAAADKAGLFLWVKEHA